MFILNRKSVTEAIVNNSSEYTKFNMLLLPKNYPEVIMGIVDAQYMAPHIKVCVYNDEDTEDFLSYGVPSFKFHWFGGYYIPKIHDTYPIVLYRYSEYDKSSKVYIHNLLSKWHKGKILVFG